MTEGGGVGAGRSTAIILFTDLVGSTELRSRLGEEAADELRRRHDRLVTDRIEANRGQLVKNLGDGLMATFAGASDGVAAAVSIQQVLDRHNRSGASAAPLEVRIGLSAGDVAIEEGDCFGTPVIEAARLCAAAEARQILASEMVRWLARSGAAFIPVGTLDLKGLPDPVPVVRVGWDPLPQSSAPLPSLLTDIGRIFVGRDAEVERLQQLWKEAAAGEFRVVLLGGEPGVGKTRLAAELAANVHAEGGLVLAGRCDEDLGVPYQPFVEALRHFVDHTPPADLSERLGRYGGELARLVPELTVDVPDLPLPVHSDPETERYRLFDAVAAWLGVTSAEEPLLLVLDDLQWAAKPTLLLLRHLVRSPLTKRVLVLGTYRDTELGHHHPLVEVLADLRRQGATERISLVGLDSSRVAAFMEQAAGHAMGDEELALARAIHEETEGNPFFVREVLRHLAETGAIERREGRWGNRLPIEELGIPEGVRDVVGRRLSRLSETANRALQVAAVIGAEFEFPVIQAADDLDAEALVCSLEEAIAARLVIEGGQARYRFAHALVRDTIYGELSAARRVAMHRRVAEAIQSVHAASLDDHLPALAHHWARASAPAADTARAIDYSRRAGDRALAQLAHDEAAVYYRQALELLDVAAGGPVEETRLELLISLGEALRRDGDPAHREILLEAVRLAQHLGDPERLARAALANSRGTFSAAGMADQDRVAAIEAALGAIGDRHDAMKARLLANLAVELTWVADLERRSALSGEAVSLARRLGDRDVLGSVLTARAIAIQDPSTVEERLQLTAEAVEIVERSQDPTMRIFGHRRRVDALMEIGDMAEAERHLRAQEQVAGEGPQHPFLRFLVRSHRATKLLAAGQFEKAEAASRDALASGLEAGHGDAQVMFAVQLTSIRFEQGRSDDQIAVELAAAADRLSGLPFLRAMLALMYCELDRLDEARIAFQILAESGLRRIPRDNAWGPTMAIASIVCARLGDADQAAILYELLSPYDHLIASHPLAWYGAFALHLGALSTTLGRYNDAEGHFSSAADIHERIAAPGALARTRLEWARMLLNRRHPGDPERARELLDRALATAREIGQANVERRAVEFLTARS
jgi:class 3 adenylate cyclase/tetratricopeptide (TPR) repeat protein